MGESERHHTGAGRGYQPLTRRTSKVRGLLQEAPFLSCGSRTWCDPPAARTQASRSYAAEPEILIEQLKAAEAIAEADTLLLTVPNQLGGAYNAHVIEAILTHVAPGLGWR